MLASVQKIKEINPIKGADFIEVAKVMGWSVVVKKGEFKVGDDCIFVEIDSLVPRRSWSEFLFNPDKTNEYHRLRTVKLRKQISQGLVINIDDLKNTTLRQEWKKGLDISGWDVTDILGIKKYEKPVKLGSQSLKTRNFPHFLRKTDEVRIQSNQELLEELKGKPYYITQKLDGTSATYYKFKNKFGVCSRNLEISNPNRPKGFYQHWRLKIRKWLGLAKKEIPLKSVYWKMAKKYNIEEWLPEGYAIQGEIVGPGIQKNRIGLEEIELYIFNVWNIEEQKYINPYKFSRKYKTFSFQIVPYATDCISPGFEPGFLYTQEELLKIADNQKYPNNSVAEGIVIRSIDQEISFKVVSNKFMLKYKE